MDGVGGREGLWRRRSHSGIRPCGARAVWEGGFSILRKYSNALRRKGGRNCEGAVLVRECPAVRRNGGLEVSRNFEHNIQISAALFCAPVSFLEYLFGISPVPSMLPSSFFSQSLCTNSRFWIFVITHSYHQKGGFLLTSSVIPFSFKPISFSLPQPFVCLAGTTVCKIFEVLGVDFFQRELNFSRRPNRSVLPLFSLLCPLSLCFCHVQGGTDKGAFLMTHRFSVIQIFEFVSAVKRRERNDPEVIKSHPLPLSDGGEEIMILDLVFSCTHEPFVIPSPFICLCLMHAVPSFPEEE